MSRQPTVSMHCDSPEFRQSARWLRAAGHVVVATGAGASAESGIATFRDRDGLWQEFLPEQFATWGGLLRTAALHPRRLARFVIAVLEPVARAIPNAGHRAVAELERHTQVTVITQNIDGLHSDAGSSVVHEIHGSLFEIVTLGGRHVRRVRRDGMLKIVQSLERAAEGQLSLPRLLAAIRPIFGLGLRGMHRPNVVMFGQAMAEPDWQLAQRAVRQCDCLITVGTSEEVMPAAGLPGEAARAGAKIIRVDPSPGFGHAWLPGPSAVVLPALVDAAFGTGENPA